MISENGDDLRRKVEVLLKVGLLLEVDLVRMHQVRLLVV